MILLALVLSGWKWLGQSWNIFALQSSVEFRAGRVRCEFTAPQLLLGEGGNFVTYLKAAEGLPAHCQPLKHCTGKPPKPQPFSGVFYVLTPLAAPLVFGGSFARA